MSRYIDADMLYVDWYDSFIADDGTVYDNFPLISKEQIDNAPTIELKRGEWIEMYRNGFGNMICMCSKCNFHATKSNFCPNCGADMRESNSSIIDRIDK